MAADGRVSKDLVDEEIALLPKVDSSLAAVSKDLVNDVIGPHKANGLDSFVRVQLNDVLTVCRQSPNMAAAGRQLFSESRKTLSRTNDSDRLAKYLSKFDLRWQDILVSQ